MKRSKKPFPYAHLLWEMLRAEILLRDQGTMLGFLWTLLHPALMFAVLYGLFIRWMGHYVAGYPIYLLIGLVLWNFFSKATAYGMSSLARHRGLIRNYRFPREIIVLASVGAVFWSTLLELFVLSFVVLALGRGVTASWLCLPVLAALLLVLVTALTLFLAVLSVEYQDMERIWEIVSMTLFYLTPIFYPLSIISQGKRSWLLLSPLTQILIAFRRCVIVGAWPGPVLLPALGAVGCFGVAAGIWLMRRLEHHLADRLMI